MLLIVKKKPIEIVAVEGGYNVIAKGAPLLRTSEGKIDFDRVTAGLKTAKRYKAPVGDVAVFTAEEARSMAHTVGRYCFKLGDLVFSYAAAPAGFWE